MSSFKPITEREYLMGREKPEALSPELRGNMTRLLNSVNGLMAEFGEYRKVNSGYRRAIDNKAAGGSPRSAHLTCEAVDLEDKDGALKAFCNEDILDKWQLYMEDTSATPSWCHLQCRATKSGNRVFKP